MIFRKDAAGGERCLPLGRELLIFRVRGIATELCFRLRKQRPVAGEVRFGLCERRLERPAVECEELLFLPDEIAFAKRNVGELTRHLGPDRDHGVCLDIADCGNVNGHILFHDLRRHDRGSPAVAAAAAPTPARRATRGGCVASAPAEHEARREA